MLAGMLKAMAARSEAVTWKKSKPPKPTKSPYKSVEKDEKDEGAQNFDYKKWANFRMSEGCLRDLFVRLDADGNGVLELLEFVNITKKLKIMCPPALLVEIFARTDADGNGHMTMDEFIMAYNLLYDTIPQLAMGMHNQQSREDACFIWVSVHA
jgi:hypothetical protein